MVEALSLVELFLYSRLAAILVSCQLRHRTVMEIELHLMVFLMLIQWALVILLSEIRREHLIRLWTEHQGSVVLGRLNIIKDIPILNWSVAAQIPIIIFNFLNSCRFWELLLPFLEKLHSSWSIGMEEVWWLCWRLVLVIIQVLLYQLD